MSVMCPEQEMGLRNRARNRPWVEVAGHAGGGELQELSVQEQPHRGHIPRKTVLGVGLGHSDT